jgi:tetratricopeptide (TPR) repeat protein
MTYSGPSKEARSWLDAGLAAHRAGDFDRAVSCYRQALVVAPASPDALNLLGTALLQTGNAGEAVPHLEAAARLQRNNPHVLANLGQCYIALGRHEAAADAFRKASRLQPKDVQLQLGLAGALALQRKFADAEALLERLARRAPDNAAVWLNLGNVMRDQQRRQEAIDLYSKAVALDPAMPEARNNLGSALHAKLRFAEAEEQYRECIRIAPGLLIAHFNLASVLMDLGRFAESEGIARELAARAPDAPEPARLLGSALGMQSRLLEARACYEYAARIAPDSAKACETLAMSYMETGRVQQGLRIFSGALALGSDPAATRQLIGGALLADSAIHDGLDEYRERHDAAMFRQKHPEIPITQSVVADPAGRRVCVIGEQGLGDELFFLRYAQALADRGATLTYRAGEKIATLVARLPALSNVITAAEPLPPADAYMLVGDLAHALEECPASALPEPPVAQLPIREFPRLIKLGWPPVPRSARIEPLPDKSAAVRARLAALGPAPYIGITWRAGTLPEEQRASNWLLYKSIDLRALAAALDGVGGTLVALQRAPAAFEFTTLSEALGRPVHDLCALNDDLEAMLALLAQIDDYVGVSNTNMHLRAAAGKTARVLVPAPAEWRWLRSGRESPWFPGFTIYRQSLQGDWRDALAALHRDLLGNYGQLRGSTRS